MDQFLFARFNDALFTAGVDHHPDFLFGDVIVLLVGVNVQQAQDTVGRYSQEPDKGGEDFCDNRQGVRH